MNEDIKKMHASLNALLATTDLTDVTAESSGFSELPEGYYLCEVEEAKLTTSKTSGAPMVSLRFKVVEDGHAVEIDEVGNVNMTDLKKTSNRKIFTHYPFKDDRSVKRFVTDMLKFEGETPGESLLPKEAFTTAETLEDALGALIGMRIYVQVSVTINDDDSKSVWNNLISWKRASALELPM